MKRRKKKLCRKLREKESHLRLFFLNLEENEMIVRRFENKDAKEVSELIVATLRTIVF